MATKIVIKKDLEKKLRKLAADETVLGMTLPTLARQLIGLCDDSVAKQGEGKQGLTAQAAIDQIRAVLGPSALLPPTVTIAFRSFVKKRINFLGLSLEDIENASIKVKNNAGGPIGVEWIIRNIERILGDSVNWKPRVKHSSEAPWTGRGD